MEEHSFSSKILQKRTGLLNEQAAYYIESVMWRGLLKLFSELLR
jgi:hypothetical protein